MNETKISETPRRKRQYSEERNRKISAAMTKHGMSSTVEYETWERIWSRCTDLKNKSYHNYGGRGISVCDRWQKFENFYADMGKRPSDRHSLDRINNDGNYEPSNCRWITHAEQQANKRTCVYIEFNGVRLTATEWSRRLGMPRRTISNRAKLGWEPCRILTPYR